MAKEKKEENEKSSDEDASKTVELEKSESMPDAAAEAKKSSVWEKYRSEVRIAFIGAVATVLIASAFTPVRHWTGGAIDEVHDFLLGYNGQRLDTMKETIEQRPFWQEGPSFKDGAFGYVADSDNDEGVVSTLGYGGTMAEVITIDELVNNAPDYEGEPLIVVGRNFEESSLETSGSFPLISKEVVLTGNDRYAYVGTDSYSAPWRGLVAYVGILVATGRAVHEEFPEGVPTAYFFGAKGVAVNPNDPALRSPLRKLAPDEFP